MARVQLFGFGQQVTLKAILGRGVTVKGHGSDRNAFGWVNSSRRADDKHRLAAVAKDTHHPSELDPRAELVIPGELPDREDEVRWFRVPWPGGMGIVIGKVTRVNGRIGSYSDSDGPFGYLSAAGVFDAWEVAIPPMNGTSLIVVAVSEDMIS